jgi:hypothetical protein
MKRQLKLGWPCGRSERFSLNQPCYNLKWRGARVAEWDGLENRCGFRVTVGSNPTLSARTIRHE